MAAIDLLDSSSPFSLSEHMAEPAAVKVGVNFNFEENLMKGEMGIGA